MCHRRSGELSTRSTLSLSGLTNFFMWPMLLNLLWPMKFSMITALPFFSSTRYDSGSVDVVRSCHPLLCHSIMSLSPWVSELLGCIPFCLHQFVARKAFFLVVTQFHVVCALVKFHSGLALIAKLWMDLEQYCAKPRKLCSSDQSILCFRCLHNGFNLVTRHL